ncbi:MAG TPA: hypothetical protein VFO31_21315, partial [Vicinamibacterales bacterium]|nr:hypothetical protein [Vicinamibacterales bacterium]
MKLWTTLVAEPVNVGADTAPAGVPAETAPELPAIVCVCVPSADPVNVGAETVPAGVPALTASELPESVWSWFASEEPVNVGTPAGHAIVPWLVMLTVPVAVVTGETPVPVVFDVTRSGVAFVDAAATAFPVNVAVVPECVGTPAGQAIVPA